MAEHLIPLTDLATFTDNFQIHLQETIQHYIEVIEHLAMVTFNSEKTITFEEINDLIGKHFYVCHEMDDKTHNYHYCLNKEDGQKDIECVE